MRFFGLGRSAENTGGVNRDPASDFWFTGLGETTSAGVSVTAQTAIRLPVVYDCLKVLSDTIASLPRGVFQRVDNGKARVESHPLVALLNNPNDSETSFEFIGQMVWDLASQGNAYREIISDGLGVPKNLKRLDNRYVTVEKLTDGTARYKYTEPGFAVRYLLQDEVLHMRNLPVVDGMVGTSPIEAGREAIAAGLALQDYASRFFKNDSTPPFVIKTPHNFKDDVSKANFLDAIGRWWGGSRRHKPGLLEFGMDIQQLGNTNEQSQFLETRKEQAIDIARLWRMPPHKVGILDRATFSNIEQQSLEFVIDTLLPWLRLIENSFNKFLIMSPDEFFFEFNVAGLLRGDLKARYEAHAIARNWGWLSVNEIRKLENMNGIGPEGDIYLQPLNMQQAGEPDRTSPPRGALNGSDASEENSLLN